MSWATKTYTFSPSTTASSSEVNTNFTDLVNAINIAMPSAATGKGIIMFSGAIADIPTGWYLCNGSNGTPDLRDKFIVGAGSTYAVAATGGGTTHTHTISTLSLSGPTVTISRDSGSASTASDTHSHTLVSGATASGSSLPPYHALAFIMKS